MSADAGPWRTYSDRDLSRWTDGQLAAFATEQHDDPDRGDELYPEVCDRCAAIVILNERAGT